MKKFSENFFENSCSPSPPIGLGNCSGTFFFKCIQLAIFFSPKNHRLLLTKIYNSTKDPNFVKAVRSLLENRRFYVVMGNSNSRWRNQKNGLPQGSVLAPTLFNIYTNDQPIVQNTRSFIYADDLALATQSNDFQEIEVSLSNSLHQLSKYYAENCLRPNPTKTISSLFYLRNRDANRELNIIWEGQPVSYSLQRT